jgi:hypothetical protein
VEPGRPRHAPPLKMLYAARSLVLAALLPATSGLLLPTRHAAGASMPTIASDAADIGRRDFLAKAATAAVALGAGGMARAASAYDSIPTVEPDFAASEKARKDREAKAAAKAVQLRKKAAAIKAATSEEPFVAACDDMALWVIGEGSIPEGIRMKEFVAELKDTYESLPKKSYSCEVTRTNNGRCYTPGKGAELAFESLLKQLRQYSKIQLGDYRRVEFNAF